MAELSEAKPRGRQLRRAGLWTLTGTAVLAAVAVIGLLSLIGTRVTAPDWLRARITENINNGMAGFSVGFGDVSVVLQDDFVPRLSLRDVVLRDEGGAQLASLADVRGTVALGPLLKGKLQPGAINLSGARVTLRRAADGTLGLTLGETGAAVDEARNFAELAEHADSFFQRPPFAALREIEAENLSLLFEDARAGRTWTVDGGRIAITRDGDALQMRSDFAVLGARDYATTLAVNYASRIGGTAAEFGVTFQDVPSRDIAGQSPALSWLMALDAPISGSIRAEVFEDGSLGPIGASLEIGAGVLSPEGGARPIAFDHAQTYFTYKPKDQVIEFSQLSLDSKWVSAQAEGHTYLTGMADGWPDGLLSQLRVSRIALNPMELYAEPVRLDAAAMDMRLRLDPFEVTVGELSLIDQGRTLALSGAVTAEEAGWRVAMDGRMDGIAPDRLLQLWPESLVPNTRGWIAENVSKGEMRNVQIALRSGPGTSPDVYLGFDFSGLTARFMKALPEIEEGTGHASILKNRFVIAAQGGFITAAEGGRIGIAGSSFVIPDIRVKRGPAEVSLATDSTITAALSLLNEQPFRFLQKAGQPVTLADGRAQMSARLDFAVKNDLQPDEVKFSVTGRLADVRSTVLVKDRVLAASKLAVEASNAALSVSGAGTLGAVRFEGGWSSPLTPGSGGASRIEARIELSQRFADEFGIGLPPGTISGAGRGDVTIDFARGRPGQFILGSNLGGMGLRIKPLDWALTQGQTGRFEVAGSLGQPPQVDRLTLEAGGLSAAGAVSLKANGQLDRAVFSRVRVGDWLDAPVELLGRGAGVVPMVRVPGGRIDLRQTSLAGGEGNGNGNTRSSGGPVSLALDRLQISDSIALTDFRAELDMTQGANGSFSGKVNGLNPIQGRVVPQNGRSAFRIQSDDAGGVMRSAKLLQQARDGVLDLTLTPAAGPGTYDGRLLVQNMRVKDAPAMAALLNAVSVVGLLEQLSGEGIHFAQVDAKFRLGADRVTLYSGSAVGASMGISMEGYFEPSTGRMDVEGVVSPVYVVNALGGMFARQGEGLLGFQYSLTGTRDNPQVYVNPLSVLTPGMFREIFRRPPPQEAQASQAGQSGQTGETGQAGLAVQPEPETGSAPAERRAKPQVER